MAATGGTFEAFRAGKKAETTVMTTPTTIGMMMALGSMVSPVAGMSKPKAESSPRSPMATTDAGHDADHRRDEADDQRLDQHRAEHLATGRADGPQQRHLPAALGDDDRERVVDDEAADEQGDDGEHQQEGVEEADAARGSGSAARR